MLFQEPTRAVDVEQRVAGLEAEEEPVARRQGEARHVEDRMMRPGQPVEPEHAEHRRQRRDRIVSSNVIGMNAGQLLNGRPPTSSG